MKRQWMLEGLDCANCAMKIENKLKKIEGVSYCSVNFTMKMMTLESTASEAETISEQARQTVLSLEPHVKLREMKTGAIRKPLQTGSDHTGHPGEAGGHAHNDHDDHDHSQGTAHQHEGTSEEAHGHSHDHGTGDTRRILLRLAGGGLLAAAAMFLPVDGIPELLLFLAAYLIVGGEVVLSAARNIIRGQVFDENVSDSSGHDWGFCHW